MVILASTVPLVLLVLTTLIVARVGWRSFAARWFPAPPAHSQRTPAAARALEALTYTTLGIFLILLCGTERRNGGYLLILGDISRPLAVALLAGTGIALLAVLLAALLSWRGRATAAFFIGVVAVLGYSLFLNAGPLPAFGLVPNGDIYTKAPLNISMFGQDVPDAHLWINGVDMGTLPCLTTMGEFLAKVPVWENPPPDYETDRNARLHYALTGNPFTTYERRWIQLSVSNSPQESATQPSRKYYARVQYAGEWASAVGDYGAGGGGGRLFMNYHSSFSATFPERQKRLDTLLNIARVNNYQVGSAWFAAAETFRSDACEAVLKARASEPGMQRLWDAWANSRYPVQSASSPQDAWALFKRIQADVDAAQYYNSATPQGHAVKLLAPRLSIDRLASAAREMLREIRQGYSYSYGMRDNEFQFATSHEREFPPASRRNAGAFVTAHALLAHHLAQLKAGIYPTDVQTRFVPELLRARPDDSNLEAAVFLGGPVVADFVVRHDMHTPNPQHHQDRLYIEGKEFNKWLYYGSQMQDPVARQFRRYYQDDLLKLAAELALPFGRVTIGERVDFLFEDPALAARFWPQFSAKIRQHNYGAMLKTSFQYLNRMKADPALYLQVWKDASPSYGDSPLSAVAELAHIESRSTRQSVIDTLRAAPIPRNSAQWGFRNEQDARRAIDAALDNAIFAADHPEIDLASRKDLTTIHTLKNPNYQNIAGWLEQNEDVPLNLPAMLAVDPDPQLRYLAARALGVRPTPERRTLLATLAKDEDPGVRTAAETALRILEALRTSPLPTSER